MKKIMFTGVIVGMLVTTSCSKNNSSYNAPTGATPSTSNLVSITNMSFVAATTNVSVGTTVTWTNNDNMTHTVTADDNSFASGNLNYGDKYSHTFSTAGTISYHCTIHPTMTASVVVK